MRSSEIMDRFRELIQNSKSWNCQNQLEPPSLLILLEMYSSFDFIFHSCGSKKHVHAKSTEQVAQTKFFTPPFTLPHISHTHGILIDLCWSHMELELELFLLTQPQIRVELTVVGKLNWKMQKPCSLSDNVCTKLLLLLWLDSLGWWMWKTDGSRWIM